MFLFVCGNNGDFGYIPWSIKYTTLLRRQSADATAITFTYDPIPIQYFPRGTHRPTLCFTAVQYQYEKANTLAVALAPYRMYAHTHALRITRPKAHCGDNSEQELLAHFSHVLATLGDNT
ncbi:MAG: hypothetical protein ACOH2B_11450 [Burkholderiaceae bacterium]